MMGKEMKWLGCLTWLITSLAALNVGLEAMGWGISSWAFIYNNFSWAIQPAAYIVGLFGLISFIMWIKDTLEGC